MNCISWVLSLLTGIFYNVKIEKDTKYVERNVHYDNRDKHYDDRDKHYDNRDKYYIDKDKNYYEIIKKIRNAFVLDIADLDYINTLEKEQLIEIIKINNINIERTNE